MVIRKGLLKTSVPTAETVVDSLLLLKLVLFSENQNKDAFLFSLIGFFA